MPAWWATPLLVAALLGQSVPPSAAMLTLTYRGATEDDPPMGSFSMRVRAGPLSPAVVWEHRCRLGGMPGVGAPATESDQFWAIASELVALDRARRAVRLRVRLVRPAGRGPEVLHTIALDLREIPIVSAVSARADCSYDRIHVAASATPAR